MMLEKKMQRECRFPLGLATGNAQQVQSSTVFVVAIGPAVSSVGTGSERGEEQLRGPRKRGTQILEAKKEHD